MRGALLAAALALLAWAAPVDAGEPRPAGPAPARPPAFTAVIDPGHGGELSGATSPRGDLEKDLTLQIARRVKRRLEGLGGKVVLTRTADLRVPLANRAAVANALDADLFVSIHLNSMPTEAARRASSGVETYFLSADASDAGAEAAAARENADRLAGEPAPDPNDAVARILDDLESAAVLSGSSRLAYAVHDRLVSTLKAEDRGVKQAPFYVLAGARMPAVLLEVGFISNEAEAARLRSPDHQERIAAAVAEGVAAWRAAEAKR
jgi:N-acetylmuramoyl-L-alanine amidase